MSTLTSHLAARDPARAADWYVSVLGAAENSRVTLATGPILTIELQFGDSVLAIGDEIPGLGIVSPLTFGHFPMNASIRAAIAAIGDDAWTAIKYPHAIWDDQLGTWVSDAEVTEVKYTAFASKKDQAVTARLIVRQVRDLNKAADGQNELFPAWRCHAVFTDSPFELVQAEGQHRGHSVVEQVFAGVTSGPLAHMPSGVFAANAAWPPVAAMAHNLLRAAGVLASLTFAKARAAT